MDERYLQTLERMKEILGVLAECQINCSEICLKIGGCDDNCIVEHQVIYITECPRLVIDVLNDKGYHMSMSKQGLRIDCRF